MFFLRFQDADPGDDLLDGDLSVLGSERRTGQLFLEDRRRLALQQATPRDNAHVIADANVSGEVEAEFYV